MPVSSANRMKELFNNIEKKLKGGAIMIKLKLVVRVVKENETVGGYVKDVELPFVPIIGMKFKQGISTTLWETIDNNELSPSVKHLIYDFDEECIVALFEVSELLSSNFWTKLDYEKLGDRCAEMNYFDCV